MKEKILKSLILCLFFLMEFPLDGNAQAPSYVWLNQIGGKESDFSGLLAIDSKENVYTISGVDSLTYFQPGTPKEVKFVFGTPRYTRNLIVTKVDSRGNLIWHKKFQGFLNATSITVDERDNIIIAGRCGDTVNFFPSSGIPDYTIEAGAIFILKLNQSGSVIWAKPIRGGNMGFPYKVKTDNKNNIAIIFDFYGTVDVDMSDTGVHNINSTTYFENALLKVDSAGKFLWVHHLQEIEPITIGFDKTGNLYTSGYFVGTKDFNFGIGKYNLYSSGGKFSGDGYISKVNENGEFIWAKSFGEYYTNDYATSMVVDTNNNVIIAGKTNKGHGDFDPGIGTKDLYGNSYFILKLNKDGNYLWAKGLEVDTPNLYFSSMGINQYNQIYLSGRFDTTIDINPDTGVILLSPVSKLLNSFILNLDSNGTFNWARQIESTGDAFISSMSVTPKGDMYVGGLFSLNADFDPNTGIKSENSVGGQDIFTLKLSSCLSNNTLTLNECRHFEYDGYFFDSSEKKDFLFIDKNGCDSIVSVNMTIRPINDSISVSGSVISAYSSTATSYQWVKCPSYAPIAGATSATFTATTTGNYALIITENGCTDTSKCVSVFGLNIPNMQTDEVVHIYPNPSNGLFTISSAINNQAVVEIRSLEGKILQSRTIDNKEFVIDLNAYSAGIYFLSIRNDKGFEVIKKLVKY